MKQRVAPQEDPAIESKTAFLIVHPMAERTLPRMMDAAVNGGCKVIILQSYASGCTPHALNPKISELRDEGVPVLLLPDSRADEYGILRLAYEGQSRAAKAGAIHIETHNVKDVEIVIKRVDEIALESKDSDDLRSKLKAEFWFTPDQLAIIEEEFIANPNKIVQQAGSITRTRRLCVELGI